MGSSSTFAMSDDWKKFFTQDQLALIEANRVPKNCKRGSSSWIDAPDDAEGAQADRWVKNPVKWGQSPGASSHGAGKWAPSQHTWGAVPGRFPITTASVGNVEGEATSASSISSGIAAKVGVVDGVESHVGRPDSAAPRHTEDDEAGDEEDCNEEGEESQLDNKPVQIAYENFLCEIYRLNRLELTARENGKKLTVDMVLDTARLTNVRSMDAQKKRYKALMLLLHPDKWSRFGDLPEDIQRRAKEAYHFVEHYYFLPSSTQGPTSASANAGANASSAAGAPETSGSNQTFRPGTSSVANPLWDKLTDPDEMCYFKDPVYGENRCILCMQSGKKAFCTRDHMESRTHKKHAADWRSWYAYNRERFAPELNSILTGHDGKR